MEFLKIFLAGWTILVVAILLNFLAIKLGISTWYPFFEDVQKIGFIKAFQEISALSKLYMLAIYPLILGLAGYVILKFLK